MARRGENIRKRKDGRWEGRYIKARTSEGKIQWGYVYGTVYAEVKRVLIQKKAEAGFYNLKKSDLTFEALAEVWLHSLKNGIKESTYAHYSYTLHKYLLPVLSKMPVASFEESFLEQAMQQIITPIDSSHKPLGNSSARECLSMLRRICKYAAHLRLIRPMELEVALPKAIDKISAPLSPAEQQRLYRYVQENPTPRKIGLLLGLELGLRIGEICGLQWGDFDLKHGTLKINRTVCRISCGNGHTKVDIDDRPGLTEALYLFCQIIPLLQIALIDQIVEPCAPHLEQVVDIAGRATRVLLLLHQVPDVARTDVFQLSDLLQLQIFQQKTGRSLIIAQGAFSQMAAFTVVDKFIAEIFQTHKKTPFPSWRTTKERVKNC